MVFWDLVSNPSATYVIAEAFRKSGITPYTIIDLFIVLAMLATS